MFFKFSSSSLKSTF